MGKNHNSNSCIFILALLVIVSGLLLPLMQNMKFAAQADEGYYLRYAIAISDKGLSEFRNLFSGYIENEKNWVYPTPLRIGFIILSSLFCKIFGNSFMAIAYLSLFSHLAFIVISYYFCRRVFDKEKASLLAVLVAFSPLPMAMAMRALSDSACVLFWALAVWLFLDMLMKDKRIIKKVIFLFAFIFSVLIKETSVFLVIPFFIFMAVYKLIFKGALKWADFLYISLYPAVVLAVVYCLAAGSPGKIADMANLLLTTLTTANYNQYAIIFCSGPWYRYIIDYILLSPWTVILSIGFIAYYFTLKEFDACIFYFLILLLTTFFTLNFFTKNARYAMILDMPMRLFAVLMLKKILEAKFPNRAAPLITILVAVIAILDYINFFNLFVRNGIYDPISFLLFRARHLIPE